MPRLVTGAEAVRAICDGLGVSTLRSDPIEAQGLALAGRPGASLGSAPLGTARGLSAPCVHLVTAEPGDVPALWAASTVQEAMELTLAAFARSGSTGDPVAVWLGDLADIAELVTLPSEAGPPSPLRRDGSPDAGTVIVAAGRAAGRARRLAGKAEVAVVTVTALSPLPLDALREQLAGATAVWVVDTDGLRLPSRVAEAVGGDVRAIRLEDLPGLLRLPAPPEAGELLGVPCGNWARRALRRLAEGLVEADEVWATPTEDAIATRLRIEVAGPGNSHSADANVHGVPNVLLASAPEALGDGSVLEGVPDDTVIAVAWSGTARDLAFRLGPAGRAVLRDRSLALIAVAETTPEAVGAAAARAARDLVGSSSPTGEAGFGALDPVELDEARHAREIDFRQTEDLPRLPERPDVAPERREEWRRLTSAMWRGKAPQDTPQPSFRPLVLDAALDALKHSPSWPFDVQGASVAFGSAAPRRLLVHQLLQFGIEGRRALLDRAERRIGALDERLHADDDATGRARSAQAIRASLGPLGASVDTEALAARYATLRGAKPLHPALRQRLEAARDALVHAVVDLADWPSLVLVHGGDTSSAVPDGAMAIEHPHPTGAAVGVFDAQVDRARPLLLALRSAERCLQGLDDRDDDLDWEGLTAEELAALPPVLVELRGRPLRDRGAGGIVALVQSSRPVVALVVDTPDTARPLELSRHHLSIGTLALACREALVVEASLAQPGPLLDAFAAAARATRPVVAVVTVAAGPLPVLRSEAARLGRAALTVRYDPDRGASWADRLDVTDNPQPDRLWPTFEHRVREGREIKTLELPFTWVDAVALEPAYRDQLTVLPVEAWCDETQAPLHEVLETWRPGEPSPIPWIHGVDDTGTLCRVVVGRALAAAALEHGRAWRFVQELAGYDNPLVEAAAARARHEAEAEARARLDDVVSKHERALDQVREETAREALGRLAAALLSADGMALAAPPPEGPPPPAPVEPDAPVVEEVEDDEEDVVLGEPWLDTPMCTTCNECTNLNPALFVYNADRQAQLGDLGAGTFEELVQAAERCPARCIHPGRPRSGDVTATPEVVQRAAAFQ